MNAIPNISVAIIDVVIFSADMRPMNVIVIFIDMYINSNIRGIVIIKVLTIRCVIGIRIPSSTHKK